MAVDPSAGLSSPHEEAQRWPTRIVRAFLGILAIMAAQQALFMAGGLAVGVCRTWLGVPFYLVYLPLGSALLCLLALRLRLRFGLVYLFVAFLLLSYQAAQNYAWILGGPVVRFREVVSGFADIVTGVACSYPDRQLWAAEGYGHATMSIGLLCCIAYRFWPRRTA